MLTIRTLPLLRPKPDDMAMPATPIDGYDLVIVADGVSPDFAAAVVLGEIASVSLPVVVPAAGETVEVYLRTRKNGYASGPIELALRLQSDGEALLARPNAPEIVSCVALPNGDVRLSWRHDDLGASGVASGFRVYGDMGTGLIDWSTPLSTAPLVARQVVVSGLVPDIRHLIGVRAVTVAGAVDSNRAAVMVVPRATGPAVSAEVVARQTDL